MAKEEDVNKIELKVTGNCCEGCKKKVMKALSIKGVLKADIHPTLSKVTILGNVEQQILIKRLAKYGKRAEPWPAEPKRKVEEKKPEHKEKQVVDVPVADGNQNAKNVKRKDNSQNDNHGSGDGGDKGEKMVYTEPEFLKNVVNPTYTAVPLLSTATNLPPVSYIVNSGGTPSARVYYAVEAYPSAAYYAGCAGGAAPPPHCCTRDPYRHCPPAPPVGLSQFGEYFNDENTAGCGVM
ncbi:unnamed protein product [Spirodela intermedia]|uniref:HMA domain-containing protein n=1 Tax=Spirodela intermedia TaxID=51605 RepID=A0A7I8J1P1_SPIIN|nr:unnamed protein product [Spirodela intermedia]CAA6664135.1 unnamed protein product [Spirodela intermedia]